jgi:hypothetical protein
MTKEQSRHIWSLKHDALPDGTIPSKESLLPRDQFWMQPDHRTGVHNAFELLERRESVENTPTTLK